MASNCELLREVSAWLADLERFLRDVHRDPEARDVAHLRVRIKEATDADQD